MEEIFIILPLEFASIEPPKVTFLLPRINTLPFKLIVLESESAKAGVLLSDIKAEQGTTLFNQLVDTVAGKAWWGKNGTWFNSGNPATGANPAFTDSDMTEGIFTIYSSVSDTDGRIKRYNFGNPPTGFAIASGNADANGHGNFEYAPPSGYFALCTKNLAESG